MSQISDKNYFDNFECLVGKIFLKVLSQLFFFYLKLPLTVSTVFVAHG